MKTLIFALILAAPAVIEAAPKNNASKVTLKANQSFMTESHGAIYIQKIEKGLVTFKLQERASEGCPPPAGVPSQTLPQEKFKNIHPIYAAIDCEQDRLDREEFENLSKK